ncbi:hypothetical protein BGZ99_001774 [Dissophora globulifera]|uniref:PH domain-containing protein n=1 Tax=Dissophora globulifera TaxID=979702 RepID=A0A9P6RT59_9FUNG|nr:hypothetical protein BGZ99_001774 [Dissophora globulifera]
MLRRKSSFSSHSSSSPALSPITTRPGTSASSYHNQYHHNSASSSSSGVLRALSSLQNVLHPARRSLSVESRSSLDHGNQPLARQAVSSNRTGSYVATGGPESIRSVSSISSLGSANSNNTNHNTTGSVGSQYAVHTAIGSNHRSTLTSASLSSPTAAAGVAVMALYSPHSNGTTDSFYSTGSAISPPTTTTNGDISSPSSHSAALQLHQRTHQLSKTGASSFPLPLGSSFLQQQQHSNDGLPMLSTHSLQATDTMSEDGGLGTEDGTTDASETHSHILDNSTDPFQLRVRHLERGASYTGYLTKFSSRTFFSRKQWKRRYFVLHDMSLHCFKSSDPQHPLLESLKLSGDTIICVTDIFSGKRYCLQITSPGEKEWYVLADTAEEMSGWLRELKGTVLRFRGIPLDSRPGTHYSDSSEMSDLSSSSAAMADGAPAMPAFPTQYELFMLASRSPSPPPRPPPPGQHLDLYHFSSLSAVALSTKPATTSTSAVSGSGSLDGQQQQGPPIRRRKSSSVSSGHIPAEYASFGTIMEQAEALPPVDDRFLTPQHPPTQLAAPSRYRRGSDVSGFSNDLSVALAQAAIMGSNNSSSNNISITTNSSGSTNSANGNGNGNGNGSGRRTSVTVDRPETMITLPRRSSQRLMGSPSGPMSPVSSRPTSPNVNRSSPRSSLVVSPPPRSIHRPINASAPRHSIQVSSMPLAALAQQSTNNRTLHASLSRATSSGGGGVGKNRHFRDSSLAELSTSNSLYINTFQERKYRSPSRPTLISTGPGPLSPTPSMISTPTSPLTEPPSPASPTTSVSSGLGTSNGSGGGSSNSTGNTSASRTSMKLTLSNGSAQRIPIVPRHHDPEQLVKNRGHSKTRSRSKSQDLGLGANPVDMALANRVATPSPRIGAVPTTINSPSSALPTATTATATTTGTTVATKHASLTAPPLVSSAWASLDGVSTKHMSMLHSGRLVLPPPPTGEQPEPPGVVGGASNSVNGNGDLHPKQSLSNAANASPSFGGPVSRKHSIGSSSNPRFSTLPLIPLGTATLIPPPPPNTALPPVPLPQLPVAQPALPPAPSATLELPPIPSKQSDSQESITERMEALAMRSRHMSITMMEEIRQLAAENDNSSSSFSSSSPSSFSSTATTLEETVVSKEEAKPEALTMEHAKQDSEKTTETGSTPTAVETKEPEHEPPQVQQQVVVEVQEVVVRQAMGFEMILEEEEEQEDEEEEEQEQEEGLEHESIVIEEKDDGSGAGTGASINGQDVEAVVVDTDNKQATDLVEAVDAALPGDDTLSPDSMLPVLAAVGGKETESAEQNVSV